MAPLAKSSPTTAGNDKTLSADEPALRKEEKR